MTKKIQGQESHSGNFSEILRNLQCSILVTTYHANQVIAIGSYQNKLSFDFTYYQRPMGVVKTPTGLALATKNEVWSLPAQQDIAKHIQPEGQFDIAFLTRNCHITGPVQPHELAWHVDEPILVNTVCNCLVALRPPYSFVPIWKPPFIGDTQPEDKCHLNGVAMQEDGAAPAYVTMHGISNEKRGWRETKSDGGVIMDVLTNEIVSKGLSMPHSPRLYKGELFVLNS